MTRDDLFARLVWRRVDEVPDNFLDLVVAVKEPGMSPSFVGDYTGLTRRPHGAVEAWDTGCGCCVGAAEIEELGFLKGTAPRRHA